MVKNLLLVTALLTSAFTFSQKDISVTMNTPAGGSTVETNTDMQLNFTVTNSGTDDLIATDSVYYAFGFNNGGTFNSLFGTTILLAARMDAVVTAGNSWDVDFTVPENILDQLQFTNGDLQGTIPLCVVVYLYEGTNANPTTDADPQNNFGCNDVTFVADYASLEENSANATKVFPNPAEDVVTIETTAEGQKTVEILDLSGKVVASENFSTASTQLDVSELNSGLYIYNVSVNNEVVASNKLMVK